MFARVMKTGLKKPTMDAAIREWAGHIAPFKGVGLDRAYMLVNRDTGAYLSITLWESEDAQKRNAGSDDQVKSRDDVTRKYFTAKPQAFTFEVAPIVGDD